MPMMATTDRPADLPDMSGLSEEEKKQVVLVLQKAKVGIQLVHVSELLKVAETVGVLQGEGVAGGIVVS